jgi:hypothetical protein
MWIANSAALADEGLSLHASTDFSITIRYPRLPHLSPPSDHKTHNSVSHFSQKTPAKQQDPGRIRGPIISAKKKGV